MNTLTCVYCSHAYPEGTPPHGSKVLTDHIKICEKHPLRKAESHISKLRTALSGLIGEDTREGLQAMEAAIRVVPAPSADKAVMIDAIHALLETEPDP